MKRFFTIVVAALAMATIALVSAFVAMRVAIHGREVQIPSLTGMSVTDAAKLARSKGFSLNLENRFYSSETAAGRILAQDPAPGSRVRRLWQVRITESLGPQQVSIPDLTGESERAAAVALKRLQLEPGVVARMPMPGDSDVVLTQTPGPNSSVDGPRVSLLVSDPPDAQSSAEAYVMPSLIGLNYQTASFRANSAGLHLVVATDAAAQVPADGAAGASPAPVPPAPTVGTILGQYPAPGRRVQRGDAVHVTVGLPSTSASLQ